MSQIFEKGATYMGGTKTIRIAQPYTMSGREYATAFVTEPGKPSSFKQLVPGDLAVLERVGSAR